MEPLSTQLYAFGIVLLAGVTLGLFFDLFRVIRGLLRPGLLSTPLLDLLFWALATPVLILYLILANWGELRGYVVVGLALGLFFYQLLLSDLVTALLLWFVQMLFGFLNLLISFLLWLVSFPVLLVQEAKFSYLSKNRVKKKILFKPRLRWRNRTKN